jgi:hypothetical protein
MPIRDHIRRAAREIAKSMEARLTDIKHRLVEAKEQVSEIEAERDAVATARQRLAKFPIERGGTYLCPRCWVENGGLAPLRPIPSDARHDLLRSMRIRTPHSSCVTTWAGRALGFVRPRRDPIWPTLPHRVGQNLLVERSRS